MGKPRRPGTTVRVFLPSRGICGPSGGHFLMPPHLRPVETAACGLGLCQCLGPLLTARKLCGLLLHSPLQPREETRETCTAVWTSLGLRFVLCKRDRSSHSGRPWT